MNVLYTNMSPKIVIEFFVGFGPFLFNINEMHTMTYLAFKLLRFGRLFEMENQINEILEQYGSTMTRAETQNLRQQMEIWQFIVQTIINLHLLTCIQIALCTYRNFEKSWMGGLEVN